MNPRLLAALVVGLALLAPPALAQSASRNELSLGATTFSYTSYQRPTPGFLVLEAAFHRRLASEGPWSALRLGGGLRTGMPGGSHFPLEGFVQVQLTARIGIWEAVVGPELGVSGFARLIGDTLLPKELRDVEDSRFGPAYVAFNMAPVRLHFGRVVVSALELQMGTNATVIGSTIRTQLGLLRLGMEL
jgi:hypothetical protein